MLRKNYLGTNNCLLKPLLGQICIDVVARTGRVPRPTTQPKIITKVFENLEKFVRGVFVDSQHLRAFHVVHDKEGLLRVWLVASETEEEIN